MYKRQVRIVGDGPLLDPIKEEARTLGVDDLLALPGRRDSVDMLPDCDALVVLSLIHILKYCTAILFRGYYL